MLFPWLHLASGAREEKGLRAVNINHITVKVPDLHRTSEFYQSFFAMPLKQHSAKTHILGVGSSFFGVEQGDRPTAWVDHFDFGIANFDADRLHALDDEISRLKLELAASRREALDAAQMHQFVISDLTFHTVLMRMAGNARLIKVANETRLLIRIFISMRREGHTTADLERIYNEHEGVVHALEKEDPDRTARLLSEHIQLSLRERLDQYDHWEREASLGQHLPTFLGVPKITQAP